GRVEALMEEDNASATAIAVVGNDVYIAGGGTNGRRGVARYWKNGKVGYLSNGSKDNAGAIGIAVSNDNIYLAGFENDVAQCWKNGVATKLADGYRPTSIIADGNDIY